MIKLNTNKTPKNNSMEIAFIIDKSGSMYHLTKSTIKNFNSLIKKHKKRNQNITTSVILFNHETKVLYNHLPINEIPTMTDKDYHADGCTALLDAIGKSITNTKNIYRHAKKEDIPQKTLFIIITDGYENSSQLYSYRDIKKMISTQKEKYKWEFLFIGANIDAIKAANDIGIHKDFACNMIADDKGIDTVFDSVSSCVKMCMTPTLNISRNWKTKLEKDYNKRAKNKVK